MSKKQARRPYRGVPIVEIDGQKVTMTDLSPVHGLKRRPLPDGRYYIIYRNRERKEGQLTLVGRTKTFGKDPTWAVYRFVCWREGLKRRYRRLSRRRRWPGGATKTCARCDGKEVL